MLPPPLGIKPRAFDFYATHATVWPISPFAERLRPLDHYMVMLYKNSKSKNQ